MSKLEEAKVILNALQVPIPQQNNTCCCALLSMAGLLENTEWANATNDWIRIHDMIAFSNSNYGTTYAENSRETVRKQAIHHFRNAAFIEDNGKATNSPNFRYRLTNEMLALLQSFRTSAWEDNLIDWMEQINNLQSSGVHSDVTRDQAMQCIIHTYIALGDILKLRDYAR